MLRRAHNSMPLAAPGPAGEIPQWVQVLPAGEFVGRDGAGPYHLDDPQGVIVTTEAAAAGADLPIDYDHQLLWSRDNGQPAIAAGWFKGFAVRDGSLWARVEWTPAAASRLRDREYRYLSPVFWHDASGRIIRIEHAALTNTPNLELEAIASRTHNNGGDMDPKEYAALCVALGLPTETSAEQLVAHAKALAGRDNGAGGRQVVAMARSLGLPPTATLDAVKGCLDAVVESVGETAKALGLPADTDPLFLADHAKTLAANKGQTTDPDPTKWAPVSELQAVASRLAALEGSQAQARAVDAVDAAMKAGKVTPGNKDWAMAYASKDLEGFKAFAAVAPSIVKPGPEGPSGQPPAADGQLDEAALAVCSQMGISADDYKRNIKEVG